MKKIFTLDNYSITKPFYTFLVFFSLTCLYVNFKFAPFKNYDYITVVVYYCAIIAFLFAGARSFRQDKVVLDQYGFLYNCSLFSGLINLYSFFIPFEYLEETIVKRNIYLSLKLTNGHKKYVPVFGIRFANTIIKDQAPYYLEDKLKEHISELRNGLSDEK